MKRLLSAILVLTMILALVPAVFAADAGEVILEGETLNAATVYTNDGSGKDAVTLIHADGVIGIEAINVRRYSLIKTNGPMIAVEFTVPATGRYTISFKTDATGKNQASTAAAPKVYISAVTVTDNTTRQFSSFRGSSPIEVGYFNFSTLTDANEYMPITIDTAGEDTGAAIVTKRLTAGKQYMLILFCDGKSVELNPVTQHTDPLPDCEPNENYGMCAPGTTSVISPNYKQNIRFTGIKFTPVEDIELTAAFTVAKKPETDYNEPTVITISKDGMDDITSVKNPDGTHDITAPETNKNGAKFLYWAKGLSAQKRIVSFDATLKNYVPEGNGVNYLVPVYENDISDTTPEYYNLNGELIAKKNEEPAYPSIPGLGKAEAWVNCGGNIWVAEYADTVPEENITITKGDNCTLNKTGKYAYGEKVTCMATGDGMFKCWKKSDINGKTEIVSVDSTYTFRAWENCTVTAVYEEHIPVATAMKIIIDSFDIDGDTGIMAEFIGITNAVEKGIMFTDATSKETRKIAMTTKDNQFTVIADAEGTYKGYAVVGDADDGYTLITDGSYTKPKE